MHNFFISIGIDLAIVDLCLINQIAVIE